MKLVRSDSPEVVNSLAAHRPGALACWGWSLPIVVCIASAPGLLILLVGSVAVSIRIALWLGVPIILVLNGYLLWRGRSSRLNWVAAGCADRLYVRLFVQRGRRRGHIEEPDVIIFEAPEIASISIRSVEVFLDGLKPKSLEWMVIEPIQALAETTFNHLRPLLRPPGKQVLVVNEKGGFAIKWDWCRPAVRAFLPRVARECPSIVIAPEEHSELDLNGIWRGISKNLRRNPDAEEREKLVRAMRLGFGCKCAGLLSRYKWMPYREAAAYLAEIERTGPEAEPGKRPSMSRWG